MRDAPLTFTAVPSEREATTVMRLNGPLTLENLFTFQNEFRSTRPPTLIVDMAGVPYMDSAGLGLLINGHVSAEKDGRRFLLAGVNDRVMMLFQLTRVDTVLKTFPSVPQAERSV